MKARNFPNRSRFAGFVVCALAIFSLALVHSARGADDPFVGTFSTAEGAKPPLKLNLKAGETDGSYIGTIEKDGDTFPLIARRDARDEGHITGSFKAGGDKFPLDVALGKTKGRVALSSGELHFDLVAAPAAAVNPLTKHDMAKAGGTVVLMPQKIVDETMHMDAATILVPQGWKLDGQVAWIPPGAGLAVTFVAVLDPNTQSMAQFYPQITFTDGVRESQIRADQATTGGRMRAFYEKQLAEGNLDNGGSEIRHIPATPLDYIKDFLVPRFRPEMKGVEVKLVEQKDLPEYAATVAGRRVNGKGAASRIRMSYTLNDQKFEEIFVCTLVSQPIGVGPQAWSIWSADVASYRAPAGKLDATMPIFMAVHDSITTELPWFNLVQQIGEKIIAAEKDKLQQMIRNTAVRMDAMHEYARQAQADVSDRIRKNFADQQNAKAAAHDKFMDYVNDLQKVQNPATGQTVKVPAGYRRVFQSSDGGIIVSDDPTYEPPVTPNTSWTQLQAAK